MGFKIFTSSALTRLTNRHCAGRFWKKKKKYYYRCSEVSIRKSRYELSLRNHGAQVNTELLYRQTFRLDYRHFIRQTVRKVVETIKIGYGSEWKKKKKRTKVDYLTQFSLNVCNGFYRGMRTFPSSPTWPWPCRTKRKKKHDNAACTLYFMLYLLFLASPTHVLE